jgi:hypothetical protein
MSDKQLPEFLETELKRQTKAPPADDAAVERVLSRLAGPLPRQKMPLWRLPGVLLDWQFAPAWPRVAALACCAVFGFFGDIGSIVSEPEPLTGARP